MLFSLFSKRKEILLSFLFLNKRKTEVVIFGTKARITQVSSFRACFGNYELDRVSEFKYLSVALDENLSWKAHVNYLITKGGKSVGMLGRLWKNLTVAAVNAMYKSLIAPIFDYCDSVWSCCNKCDAGRLERLQRRAARIVALMSDSSDTAMQILNWNTLESRRDKHVFKDGASFCYCAYVLRISGYSGFLRNFCPLIQQYFCAVYVYVEKADLSKGYQNPKRKLG